MPLILSLIETIAAAYDAVAAEGVAAEGFADEAAAYFAGCNLPVAKPASRIET